MTEDSRAWAVINGEGNIHEVWHRAEDAARHVAELNENERASGPFYVIWLALASTEVLE